MNDRLKFRAWDCFNGCYYHSDKYKSLASFFNECQMAIDGGNKIIYEQCVGLWDKNSILIFEGDIIKNYWNNVNGEFIGRNWIVKFGKHDTSDDYNSETAWGFYAEAGEEEHSLHNLPCNNDGSIEIIGNIHEDKELEGK